MTWVTAVLQPARDCTQSIRQLIKTVYTLQLPLLIGSGQDSRYAETVSFRHADSFVSVYVWQCAHFAMSSGCSTCTFLDTVEQCDAFTMTSQLTCIACTPVGGCQRFRHFFPSSRPISCPNLVPKQLFAVAPCSCLRLKPRRWSPTMTQNVEADAWAESHRQNGAALESRAHAACSRLNTLFDDVWVSPVQE